MNIFLGWGHSAEQKIPGVGRYSWCRRAISMLIGNCFWKTIKEYPDFDFKPLKIKNCWYNTIKIPSFPSFCKKTCSIKKQVKKSFSWTTWSQFDEQFFPVYWKLFRNCSFLLDMKNEESLKNTRIFSSQNFPEDPKKYQNQNCMLWKIQQAYLSLYYLIEVPPPRQKIGVQ